MNGLESRVEAAESRARELLAQRDDARKQASAVPLTTPVVLVGVSYRVSGVFRRFV